MLDRSVRRAGHEPLRHQVTGDARCVTVETGSELIAPFQIKTRRLYLHGERRAAGAAAPAPPLLRQCQQPAAKPIAPQIFGKEETVNPQLSEITAAVEAAQNLAGN